jgi:hypothetical protein
MGSRDIQFNDHPSTSTTHLKPVLTNFSKLLAISHLISDGIFCEAQNG